MELDCSLLPPKLMSGRREESGDLCAVKIDGNASTKGNEPARFKAGLDFAGIVKGKVQVAFLQCVNADGEVASSDGADGG